MNKSNKENIIKNGIVGIFLILGYISIQTQVSLPNFPSDKGILGSLLVAVSILSVTACFGNFSFTYEKVDTKNNTARLLAHLTTGLLMLLIGLSLEMTSVIIRLLIGSFSIFDLCLFMLYFSSVLYDFWDLNRSEM